MPDRKYVILDDSDVVNVDFNEVLETSESTLRWSVDGTKTFVKFIGSTPSFLVGKDQLNHAQITETLSGEAWTAPNNPE